MRANFEQMRKLHEQFRSQVLGALTPAHRQLLASVVGNLAVSTNPDRRAAVAQLDNALSSGEKTAILNDAKQFADQMKSMMAQMRAAHPWPKASGAPRPMHSHRPHKAPTAGGILLMVASGGGRGMAMGHFGGGPPHR